MILPVLPRAPAPLLLALTVGCSWWLPASDPPPDDTDDTDEETATETDSGKDTAHTDAASDLPDPSRVDDPSGPKQLHGTIEVTFPEVDDGFGRYDTLRLSGTFTVMNDVVVSHLDARYALGDIPHVTCRLRLVGAWDPGKATVTPSVLATGTATGTWVEETCDHETPSAHAVYGPALAADLSTLLALKLDLSSDGWEVDGEPLGDLRARLEARYGQPVSYALLAKTTALGVPKMTEIAPYTVVGVLY